MATISEALRIAFLHQQEGRLPEAEQICHQILAAEPNYVGVWNLLGAIACDSGQYDAAVERFRRAVQLMPDFAEAHYNLGNALRCQGAQGDAIECYRRALELKPDFPEAQNNLGLALQNRGLLDDAVTAYRRAMELNPEYAPAHNGLGTVFQMQNQLDQSVASYRRALELKPDFADALNNLGHVLNTQERFDESAAFLLRAIQLQPKLAEAHNNLGNAFRGQGKPDEAIACYNHALALAPGYAEAHNNLGAALQEQGRLDDAIACCRRALELSPALVEAHTNLGAALRERGKLDEAVAAHRRALELNPNYAEAHNHLGTALKDQGNLAEAIACYRRALDLRPDFVAAYSNLLYTVYFCEDYDAEAIYQQHRRWNEQHAEPLAKLIQPHANNRDPSRRLRVGYVSPDFRNHCQACFTAPLLSAHNHQEFEIVCYADVGCPDGTTQRLRSYADVWRNIKGMSDLQVAELIRQDQIDILVDLTMHMAHGRSLLFARKPVPVQVCWLAYPGTTGLSAMDYRLTDPHLDPPGLLDDFYSEQPIRLPDAFWCYEPLTSGPAVNSLPALDNGFVTFGSLNNFCKVNASVLKLWASVLRAVDHSRLILLAPEGSSRQRTLDFLAQQNIAPERITFFSKQPLQQYLELYHRFDIGLDTVPANGHTTSLDSFWMGVPVVTIVGQTAVGRGGVSQLTNLGLPELIAHTPEQFVAIAASLANDLPHLSQLRATLRERLRSSPLMDAPRFARHIEAAYRTMWRRWCAA